MTPVVISPAADRDLEEIWLTIAADDPLAATRIVRAIGERIDSLGRHPRRGPRRPDVHASVRMLVEGPYLVLFETHPDTDGGRLTALSLSAWPTAGGI